MPAGGIVGSQCCDDCLPTDEEKANGKEEIKQVIIF